MKQFPDTHHDVSSNTIFGFWVYLMTDCVMFASFFAAYAVLRNGTLPIDLPFALYETIVLLMSSFAAGIAMLYAPKEKKRQLMLWYLFAFVLGVLFLSMQAIELQRLMSSGSNWQGSAFLSSYFTLVGLHGIHILVGLLLMLLFLIQLARWGFTAMVLRRLTCLRIYWQFIYLIWIFTFAIVYLIGVK
jgi:cytochrome o ubiquinol oxidase subunit 3